MRICASLTLGPLEELVSYALKTAKPEPAIYRYLLTITACNRRNACSSTIWRPTWPGASGIRRCGSIQPIFEDFRSGDFGVRAGSRVHSASGNQPRLTPQAWSLLELPSGRGTSKVVNAGNTVSWEPFVFIPVLGILDGFKVIQKQERLPSA